MKEAAEVLAWVLVFVLLSSLGFCGRSCQAGTIDGVRQLREATR